MAEVKESGGWFVANGQEGRGVLLLPGGLLYAVAHTWSGYLLARFSPVSVASLNELQARVPARMVIHTEAACYGTGIEVTSQM